MVNIYSVQEYLLLDDPKHEEDDSIAEKVINSRTNKTSCLAYVA